MRPLVVTIALLTTAWPVQAQQTPKRTVQAALDAIVKRDWRMLSNLVDSARLVEFRRENLGILVELAQRKDEIAQAERTEGSWGLSGIDSLTPALIEGVKDVRLPAFRGQSIGALAALPPREFYARFTDAANRSYERNPFRAWTSLKRRIVGELMLGDTMAYVVYRRETRQVWNSVLFHYLPGEAEIAPLRRGPAGWALLLHDDLRHRLAISGFVLGDKYRTITGNLKLRDSTRASFVTPPSPPSPPNRSASDALRAAFDAYRRADWNALAALVHPMMLADFKREQLGELIAWARERKHPPSEPFSGITLVLRSPDEDTTATPSIDDVGNVRVPIFPDSLSIADLAAAAPAQFFALTARAAYGESARSQMLDDSPRQIIGEVSESAGFVHVLYSGGPFRYEDPWRVTRMPMLRNGDDWGLLLNSDIGDRTMIGFALMMLDHPEFADSVRQ